jgi:hypothetical protein
MRLQGRTRYADLGVHERPRLPSGVARKPPAMSALRLPKDMGDVWPADFPRQNCSELELGAPVPEPQHEVADLLELATDEAIAVCHGDVRAALRAALVANSFLMAEVERLTSAVSFGFTCGRTSARQRASEKVDQWREIAEGTDIGPEPNDGAACSTGGSSSA